MKPYIVIQALNEPELINEVNNFIEDGYEPVGSPVPGGYPYTYGKCWYQAMYRDGPTKYPGHPDYKGEVIRMDDQMESERSGSLWGPSQVERPEYRAEQQQKNESWRAWVGPEAGEAQTVKGNKPITCVTSKESVDAISRDIQRADTMLCVGGPLNGHCAPRGTTHLKYGSDLTVHYERKVVSSWDYSGDVLLYEGASIDKMWEQLEAWGIHER